MWRLVVADKLGRLLLQSGFQLIQVAALVALQRSVLFAERLRFLEGPIVTALVLEYSVHALDEVGGLRY